MKTEVDHFSVCYHVRALKEQRNSLKRPLSIPRWATLRLNYSPKSKFSKIILINNTLKPVGLVSSFSSVTCAVNGAKFSLCFEFFVDVPRLWKTSQLTARMVITTQIFSIVLFISLWYRREIRKVKGVFNFIFGVRVWFGIHTQLSIFLLQLNRQFWMQGSFLSGVEFCSSYRKLKSSSNIESVLSQSTKVILHLFQFYITVIMTIIVRLSSECDKCRYVRM